MSVRRLNDSSYPDNLSTGDASDLQGRSAKVAKSPRKGFIIMPSLFSKGQSSPYKISRLLDYSLHSPVDGMSSDHIICDIDKTYLETNFDNIVQIARTAFEDAEDKVTVQGAALVLRALHWESLSGKPNPLHFVTASPPQMRSVLTEKLRLDGIHWNSATFKNQAYNIKKGRVNLLKHHVGYKTAAILSMLSAADEAYVNGDGAHGRPRVVLIGDNVERDAFIFTGVDLFLRGALSLEGYLRYLRLGDTDDGTLDEFEEVLAVRPNVEVAAICIRQAPGYTTYKAGELTQNIMYFSHFFEVALWAALRGVLSPAQLCPLALNFHNHHGLSRQKLFSALHSFSRYLPEGESSMRDHFQECFETLNFDGKPREIDQEILPSPVLPPAELSEDQILQKVASWLRST